MKRDDQEELKLPQLSYKTTLDSQKGPERLKEQ